MKTITTAFLTALANVDDVEYRLSRAMPRFAKATTHHGLRKAIEGYLVEISRSEQSTDGANPTRHTRKCDAEDLLKAGGEIKFEESAAIEYLPLILQNVKP